MLNHQPNVAGAEIRPTNGYLYSFFLPSIQIWKLLYPQYMIDPEDTVKFKQRLVSLATLIN